jgi:hypothetical protein
VYGLHASWPEPRPVGDANCDGVVATMPFPMPRLAGE